MSITKVHMEALSPTMEEGKLAAWLVKEGDSVTPGMVIAEIETDKATMEVEAVDEGIVGKILVAEGTEGVAVNTPIAFLLEEGESADAVAGGNSISASSNGVAKPEQTAPVAPPPTPVAPTPAPVVETTPGVQPVVATQPVAGTAAASASKSERVFASPLARRVARDKGIDLGSLNGSGPHNRIVLKDVEAALASRADVYAPTP